MQIGQGLSPKLGIVRGAALFSSSIQAPSFLAVYLQTPLIGQKKSPGELSSAGVVYRLFPPLGKRPLSYDCWRQLSLISRAACERQVHTHAAP